MDLLTNTDIGVKGSSFPRILPGTRGAWLSSRFYSRSWNDSTREMFIAKVV